jgi:hypothetical protein
MVGVDGWVVVVKDRAWGVRGGCEQRGRKPMKIERAANRNQRKKAETPRDETIK